MTDMAAIACQPVLTGQLGQLGGQLLGGDWLALSLLALLVSLLALSILYMFAAFFRNPQFLSWTKFELFQIFGTAVIIVFFIMTLSGICTFDMSFLSTRYAPVAPGQHTNMYFIIDAYFSKMQELGYLVFGYIMYVTKILSFLSRVTVLSSPLGVGSNENPLESMGQLNSLVFVMLSGFITSFILFQLQMRMLDYLAFACLGYLFPMGIFFRCFEPTRSFGGTLLGISVALFLFYPILMVFNDYLMYEDIAQLTQEQKDALTAANAQIPNAPPGKDVSSEIGTIYDPANPANYNGFTQGVTGGILLPMKPIMVYMVGAVVLPIINFIVLVEIARGATGFLGDELDVSNLTRLI